VQWLCALLFLALPLVRVNGDSLLRLDVPGRTLHVFGAHLRIVEFQLVLVAVLLLVFGFLLMTMVLGRVWCGWLCPQTALSDLSECLSTRLSRLRNRALRIAIQEACHAAVAFLLAAVLLWYFVPAGDFLRRLATGRLGAVAGGSLLVLAVVTYLNLALVRRLFCREICPYGRIQFMTMDRRTLTLLFEDEDARCIGCGACRAVCPMGIDIKDGARATCINCGRCLDACRKVMAARGGDGLIHYRFGTSTGEGNPRVRRGILATVVVLLGVILFTGLATRPGVTLKVQRGGAGQVKRLSGSAVNFYTAYLENRGTQEERYSLEVAPAAGARCELLGPVSDIVVPPNGDRRVDFAVQLTPPPARDVELQLHLVRQGKPVATAALPVIAAERPETNLSPPRSSP